VCSTEYPDDEEEKDVHTKDRFEHDSVILLF
jgi:hypothetical protein